MPAANSSRKPGTDWKPILKPVLIALSAAKGCYTRLNQTNVVEFNASDGATEFVKLLRTWDAGRQRLVFYVRPSGITQFKKCRDLAKARAFNIGYDAAEEDGQYVLLSR